MAQKLANQKCERERPQRIESANNENRRGAVQSIEESQTQKFLGRIRSAVATASHDYTQGNDSGRQLWRQKESVAHSLYSRRLQVFMCQEPPELRVATPSQLSNSVAC